MDGRQPRLRVRHRVTASHNPALYNGIKLFTEGGRDAVEEVTTPLADAANQLAEDDIECVPFDEAVRQVW